MTRTAPHAIPVALVAHHVVAADHPSLDRDVERFLDELRSESRHFGPSARSNPKPFPSLIAQLDQRGGFRLAAVEAGRIVGMVRVDGGGAVWLAVHADRRRSGIGTTLGEAALTRAITLHYARLVIVSSRRSRAIRRIGEQLGCTVVDGARGRTDLILDLIDRRESA